MQVHELGVGIVEFVGGDAGERAVQVVDAVEQVFGEALQGEVARGGDFALRLLLQVTVVGCGSFQAVLDACASVLRWWRL